VRFFPDVCGFFDVFDLSVLILADALFFVPG
jgi:hypothetical protein